MADNVLISYAHQTLSSMELFVFVLIQVKDVFHGNSSMEKNAFIIRLLVQKEQSGTQLHVFQTQVNVQMDSIRMEINVNHSLKDVSQVQPGAMTDVFQLVTHVHLELSKDQVDVNQQVLAKEDKVGILHFCNVSALKEPDGMEKNVSSVVEAKSGTLGMAAPAHKDSS